MSREFTPDLAECRNVAQLAVALGVNQQLLEVLASDARGIHYRMHRIPKRNARRRGHFRIVFEPLTDELKQIHRSISRRLGLYASQVDPTFPAECSNGYIRKRTIKRNAWPHCGAQLLLKADIANFFPSITVDRVQAILIALRLQPDLARLIANVLCIDGSLSLGLSASPLIANLACHDLDRRLSAIAIRHGCLYTRYADDLTFSGAVLPSFGEILSALAAEGFELSKSKFRIAKRGQAQFVTGLSVSDCTRPHAPKRMKRRLRQELYYAEKFGIDDHFNRIGVPLFQGVSRLDGTVRYVAFIEEAMSRKLREKWERLTSRDDLHAKPRPLHNRSTTQQYVAVDESVITMKNGKLLALACALFSDQDKIRQAVEDALSNYIADPFSPGRKDDIRKEGMHFTAAHPDLRNSFIERLPTLPYRCYVVLASLPDATAYAATYVSLLRWIANNLFYKCDRQQVRFLIEQNSNIAAHEPRIVLANLYTAFASGGMRRPLTSPDVEMVSKRDVRISLPDFMLSVFRRYVEDVESTSGSSQSRLQFERLRDRYSLIFHLDSKTAYTRRNPFLRESLQDLHTAHGQT